MATAQMSAESKRLSFAKVAASPVKDSAPLASFTKAASSASTRDTRKENAKLDRVAVDDGGQPNGATEIKASTSTTAKTPMSPGGSSKTESPIMPHVTTSSSSEAKLVDAVKALKVSSPMPSLVVNGSGLVNRVKPEAAEGFPDDLFHRTDSGSELGTKPPSLDGKSITSGTTGYALDEKESLRPDDSASVKAAEDDDTFSGPGSIVAGSRIGSEAAARAYRQQFYESTDKRTIQTMHERHGPGALTPQSGSSGQQATDDGKAKPLAGAAGAPETFSMFYRQSPDEKLLEALESPKDRIFLLRLEQDVIEFVKSSKEPFIDLPPCNSFCRMLTHKLADYYHMTHQVDSVAGAVRIFRTPFCRLPQPLTSISNPPTTGSTPPPTMPTMKIMRRGGDGDTGPSPSKATSETGSDGKDKNLSAKEKLSREEREAAYNKARERIFGKEEKTGDATPETEDGNEMSRSSSVSTRDRAQNKRPKPPKQRRDDSEPFDVRSQYTPYFPPQQVPTWAPVPQYAPMGPQPFSAPIPSSYPNQMAPQYAPPTQQYNPAMMNNGNMQPVYNNMQQPTFVPQPQQRFQPHSAPITAFGSPVQTPPLAPQQWVQQQQPVYQNPYQAQGAVVARPPQTTIPYAFGQLPSSANPADPKSQHPIPGSFNRHAFNPKTQSFVPGSTGLPVPSTMSHHGSSHHGSPHHGSPHLTYNAYAPPQQQFGNGMGYSMARQGSNNSLPSYHASPHMAHRAMMHPSLPQGLPQGGPQGLPHGMPQNMSQSISQGMQGMQSGQVGNHLPNYGNPSTLPPKPPTGV